MNQRILQASKSVAEGLYVNLADGKALPFMEISSPDLGDVSCNLELDHTQFVGQLDFDQFCSALALHMQQVAARLEDKEELGVFTSEDSNDIIFYLPGVIEDGGTMNVLVTGVEQRVDGELTVRLMFLDPSSLSISRH